MSEITRCVMGMPYEMAMGSELSRRQFYSIAREVYAESESAHKHWENESNNVQAMLGELIKIKAENESLLKDAERYRWLCSQGWFDNALESYGGLEILDCDDYIDASIDAAMGKGEQS